MELIIKSNAVTINPIQVIFIGKSGINLLVKIPIIPVIKVVKMIAIIVFRPYCSEPDKRSVSS